MSFRPGSGGVPFNEWHSFDASSNADPLTAEDIRKVYQRLMDQITDDWERVRAYSSRTTSLTDRLKAAYRKAAIRWHPDAGANTTQMAQVNDLRDKTIRALDSGDDRLGQALIVRLERMA